MSFNSIFFIFTFLPCILILYYVAPTTFKNYVLLFISLCFYAWGNVSTMLFLLFFILLNYYLGLRIEAGVGKHRKIRILEGIIVNVVVLAYFKYYGFFLDALFSLFPKAPSYELFPIPLGISFFVFQIIAYLIDVYKKRIKAEHNLINFALFISFFPKLIMGPIERYGNFAKQIKNHPTNFELIEKGCGKFMVGLAQKVILANTLAQVWLTCAKGNISMISAWLGILAFSLQLYFDFQGYTQMAIGLGNMFGFKLSENFNYPYLAKSISDFWRRWHMTLSSWFRDYVYIPLGGNRCPLRKQIFNILVVWGLTGLWHGANWNFIVWGLYYGGLLLLEKYVFNKRIESIHPFIRHVVTLLLIMIGWVFFASENLAVSLGYLGSLCMVRGNAFIDSTSIVILRDYGFYFIVAMIACTPIGKNIMVKMSSALKSELWYLKPIATACFFLLMIAFLMSDTYQSFLYFKF
ncbi:MAG: MBOAT family O-acyltransferase [Longicatena sp.]